MKDKKNKEAYIIAGPNGSGKTTFAKEFVKELHLPFVNADEIAIELSPRHLEKARVRAGKIFFKKIEELIGKGNSFAMETTLAGRYLLDLINKFKKNGYKTVLIYILVESPEEAIYRIENRVKKGGHPVPEKDIRRRFMRSKINFWNYYRKIVDSWEMFLNSKDEFLLVAIGYGDELQIINEDAFYIFKKEIGK